MIKNNFASLLFFFFFFFFSSTTTEAKMKESNMCYGVKLLDQCAKKTDVSLCNAVDHCSWQPINTTTNVCTNMWIVSTLTSMRSQGMQQAMTRIIMCKNVNAMNHSEVICKHSIDFCEWNSTKTKNQCYYPKQKLDDLLQDKYASEFHYNQSLTCNMHQNNKTACKADPKCEFRGMRAYSSKHFGGGNDASFCFSKKNRFRFV